MKFAYLIVAHKNPQQLKRLIERLNTEDAVFFIHIDKKADIAPFKEFLKDVNNNKVFWLNRRSIIWAGFNMIRVTVNGIREILKYDGVISHITLLSGQDYLIKRVSLYQDFLGSNAGKDFITTSPLPRPNWENGGLDRIMYYHLIFKKIRLAYPPISYLNVKLKFKEGGKWDLIKKFVSLLPKQKDFPRKFLKGYLPYEGSQWFTLSFKSAVNIIRFLDSDKKFYNYFKYTHVSDEMFFPTLMMNAPINDPNNIINDNLRYIDWSEHTGHPAIIGLKDFEILRDCPAFFARKFEDGGGQDIIDLIDAKLLKI